MEVPKMARTSSSFLAFPVTKVTGFGSTSPPPLAPNTAIFPPSFSLAAISKHRSLSTLAVKGDHFGFLSSQTTFLLWSFFSVLLFYFPLVKWTAQHTKLNHDRSGIGAAQLSHMIGPQSNSQTQEHVWSISS